MTGVESVETLGDCMLRHNYPESLVQAIFLTMHTVFSLLFDNCTFLL